MPFLSALAAALGTTGFGRGGAAGIPFDGDIEYLIVAGGGGGSPIASTIPVALALCPGQRRAAHWCKHTRLLGAGPRRPAHGFMRSACAWASWPRGCRMDWSIPFKMIVNLWR